MDRLFCEKRRLFLKQVLTAGIAAVSSEYAGLLKNAFAKGVQPPVEGFRLVSGDVHINGVAASAGSYVKPGDIIITAPNASASFVVGKNAFLLREKSHVEIIGDHEKVQKKPSLKGLKIRAGKVLSVFEQGEFRISSPTAIIGVRGTAIYIEAYPEYTYTCLCYGTADIEAVTYPGVKETLKTTHHEAPRYIFGPAAGKPILEAPMLNHTDAEVIMIESLVGRVPPFGKDPSSY